MGFLLSRKNYGFWLRPVISELGYEKGQAGLLGSTLEDFCSGLDRMHRHLSHNLPRLVFPAFWTMVTPVPGSSPASTRRCHSQMAT